MSAARVVVIGAGIVGATIAHRLARGGVRVVLVEAGSVPGRGVTRHSFGWINHATVDPVTSPAAHRASLAAVADWAALDAAFGGRLVRPDQGSLVWSETAAATEARFAPHVVPGGPTRLVGRREIAALIPRLACPPELAAWSPGEFAVEPARVARLLVRAAAEAGADVVIGRRVESIRVERARVTGVRLAGDTVLAEHVVVAAGTGSNTLLGALDGTFRIEASPAVLVFPAIETCASRRCGWSVVRRDTDMSPRSSPRARCRVSWWRWRIRE